MATDICKLHVCWALPRVPPAPLVVPPACTYHCGVAGSVAGQQGRAAQGTLGRPCPVLWRGRLCLCTFASFVMKCNKNPMFSSLPLPLPSSLESAPWAWCGLSLMVTCRHSSHEPPRTLTLAQGGIFALRVTTDQPPNPGADAPGHPWLGPRLGWQVTGTEWQV